MQGCVVMTDEALRDLVQKHDGEIRQLVLSTTNLVDSQREMTTEFKELGKRMEEISKYLAKQAVFTSKLEAIDREVSESFQRVHRRVDEIDNMQKSEAGCNSVKLLTKDIHAVTKDVNRLVGVTEEHRMSIEQLEKHHASAISPATIRWVVGVIILYLVTFGTYVVQTFSKLDTTNAALQTLVEREIKDMQEVRGKLYGYHK